MTLCQQESARRKVKGLQCGYEARRNLREVLWTPGRAGDCRSHRHKTGEAEELE